MAKKAKPIKWSIGADEPEDLQEFLTNDEIVDKHRDKKTEDIDWIGKGPHRLIVRRLSSKPNRNDDDRVSAMLVLQNNEKGSDQSWNGYVIFDGFNITEQGTPFLKRFLKSIGLTWKDFYSKADGEEDNGKTNITRIAGKKFDGSGKDVDLRATVVVKPADDFNDDEHLEIGRYIAAPGMDEDSSSGDEDSADEAATSFGDDSEPKGDRKAMEKQIKKDLKGMEVPALKKRAKRNDKKADIPDDKKALVALILEQELPPF
jgi:hypothetical protein